jgi:hypothetical protein
MNKSFCQKKSDCAGDGIALSFVKSVPDLRHGGGSSVANIYRVFYSTDETEITHTSTALLVVLTATAFAGILLKCF